MSWMVVTVIGSALPGLFDFYYVSSTKAVLDNTETVSIFLSRILFYPIMAGFLLALNSPLALACDFNQLTSQTLKLYEGVVIRGCFQ